MKPRWIKMFASAKLAWFSSWRDFAFEFHGDSNLPAGYLCLSRTLSLSLSLSLSIYLSIYLSLRSDVTTSQVNYGINNGVLFRRNKKRNWNMEIKIKLQGK